MTLLCLADKVAAVTFVDIWEYRVEGNTLLSTPVISRVLTPYLGVARTVDDINKAAAALQQEYRNLGFATVFVGIPEQDVVNGVVKLQVTETRVRRVTISGSNYFTLSGIRRNVPSLMEGQTLNIAALQSDLQHANQANKDLKMVPLVEQGPTNKSVDVELSVDDTLPLHGGLSVSNYNTEGTTPTRLSAELSYGNLWQKNHEVSFQAQTSPENTDEVQVLATSYTLPIGDNGNKLAFYAVSSNSDLATVSDVTVIGDGTIAGFRYVVPFVQSARAVHSFSLGGDYKNFKEDLRLGDGTTQKTPIDYTVWSAMYNMYAREQSITDVFSAGLSFGIRGIANDGNQFNNKRAVATPNFALLSLDWKRTYQLGAGWSASHRLRAQLADEPLVSNEEFSAGGSGSVRGYYEAQTQGDYGWIANLELTTPNMGRDLPAFDSLHGTLFFDASRVRLHDAAIGQQSDFELQSAGLGLDAQLLKTFRLNVHSGYAFKESGTIEKGNVRTRARLSMEF